MSDFFSDFLKFFFLLTPFFVLSMFIAMTGDTDETLRRKLVIRITLAALAATMILIFFGNSIFNLFGITLDAFRIGAGALLFLSAVGLVNGSTIKQATQSENDSDIAVVPLAIPITVGPATTGVLLVMGAESHSWDSLLAKCGAMTLAIIMLGIMLLGASFIERILKKRGIIIMSKLTGLILSALAAQMIFTGIINFLKTR